MASLGDRIQAQLIDYAIFIGWFIAVIILFQALDSYINPVLYAFIGLPIIFYHLLCEVFLNGQSVGKLAKNIKVIKLSGEAPSLGDYLLRWMFRLIDISLSNGLVAIVSIAATQNGQRLGDMAAGTCVIKNKVVAPRGRFNVPIEENYEISFPEVTLLTDKDVALIRKLLFKAQQHNNYDLLEKMAARVKETTGIRTELSEWDFLQTVVKDYYHYTHGDVEVR